MSSMEFEYVKVNQLFLDKKIMTISPTIKIKTDDIKNIGSTAIISQDQQFIVGYTDLVDKKLKDGPFTIFGDHTEIFKYVDFPFVQGADGIKILKADDKNIDSKFLYYALMGCYYPTGFYQRHYKLLKKTYIPDLYIEYQKKVASILNKYDQLIENNNKRIKILEDMAESLYKEWFVRFRFPGYENGSKKDSEIGKIPFNFSVLKVNEILEYYVGGGWGNDDYSEDYPIDAYVIRGADFPLVKKSDISTCPYRYHKVSNYEPRILKENDIVFEISGGTAEQPVGRAIIVTNGILKQLSNKVICASFCKLIRPNYKLITPNYFYYWLKYLYDTRIIDRYQLQSTGIINFKFEYFLKKGFVMIPDMNLMQAFEKQVKEIRNEIDNLAIQNSKLMKQRDALLPRLMSGKLEVK